MFRVQIYSIWIRNQLCLYPDPVRIRVWFLYEFWNESSPVFRVQIYSIRNRIQLFLNPGPRTDSDPDQEFFYNFLAKFCFLQNTPNAYSQTPQKGRSGPRKSSSKIRFRFFVIFLRTILAFLDLGSNWEALLVNMVLTFLSSILFDLPWRINLHTKKRKGKKECEKTNISENFPNYCTSVGYFLYPVWWGWSAHL